MCEWKIKNEVCLSHNLTWKKIIPIFLFRKKFEKNSYRFFRMAPELALLNLSKVIKIKEKQVSTL